MTPTRFKQWRKSTYSAAHAGDCVEVGAAPGQRAVRDTKMGAASPLLVFSNDSWRAFVQAASDTAN